MLIYIITIQIASIIISLLNKKQPRGNPGAAFVWFQK